MKSVYKSFLLLHRLFIISAGDNLKNTSILQLHIICLDSVFYIKAFTNVYNKQKFKITLEEYKHLCDFL